MNLASPKGIRPLAFLLLAALLLSGCVSSSLVRSWKPQGMPIVAMKKVLILAALQDKDQRRRLEDAFKTSYGADKSLVSYNILPDINRLPLKNDLMRDFALEGFDGLILLLPLSESVEAMQYQINPENYAEYWDLRYKEQVGSREKTAGAKSSAPIAKPLSLETKVYTMGNGKLVWWGITKSRPPQEGQLPVEQDAAKTVIGSLRKEGLVK